MREEYDFTDSRPNPYVKGERKPVTLRLDTYVLDYFRGEAQRTGIPYQNLINTYLMQCAREEKKLIFA